jgi:hypothetical protein
MRIADLGGCLAWLGLLNVDLHQGQARAQLHSSRRMHMVVARSQLLCHCLAVSLHPHLTLGLRAALTEHDHLFLHAVEAQHVDKPTVRRVACTCLQLMQHAVDGNHV